jgi:hypothetical protein
VIALPEQIPTEVDEEVRLILKFNKPKGRKGKGKGKKGKKKKKGKN